MCCTILRAVGAGLDSVGLDFASPVLARIQRVYSFQCFIISSQTFFCIFILGKYCNFRDLYFHAVFQGLDVDSIEGNK